MQYETISHQPPVHKKVDLVAEKRNHENDDYEINKQEAVGDFKRHAKKRPRALAVAVKIAHNGKNGQDGQDGVQADGQKVVNFCPLQLGLVESLKIKNQ